MYLRLTNPKTYAHRECAKSVALRTDVVYAGSRCPGVHGVIEMKPGVYGLLFFTAFSVVACGGGGGGSTNSGGSSLPTTVSTVTPTPAPTPTSMPTATSTPPTAPLNVSGTATEYVSGAALSGFTVTIGGVPNGSTCSSLQTATANPCGVPVVPQPTVTTSASGAFSVAVPAPGTYMLTVGKDSTYATLHRTLTVANASLALGTVKVAALSADEQAWLVDVNNQRATVSVPTSYANLSVDEYAEEQARQWALDAASGKTPYGDGGYSLYQVGYGAFAGSMYGAAGVLDEVLSSALPPVFVVADMAWMGEKANCPSGNWQLCIFANNTGHYINISNTNTVWIGLGEIPTLSPSQFGFYNLMLIENTGSTGPAAIFRARAY